MIKFEGSFRYLPQLLSVSNVYTCFYTFFLRGVGGWGGGGGVEGYIFMEKSPGFEIGKLGNYEYRTLHTNLPKILSTFKSLQKRRSADKATVLDIFSKINGA